MREEFVNFPLAGADGHFVVELAGITYPDENYRVTRINAEYLVMEYVVQGKGIIEVDGSVYRVAAGDVYLLAPGTNQQYYSDPNEPWEKLWFNVGGTLISSLIGEYNPRNMVVFPQAGGREYFERLHEIGRSETLGAAEKHRKSALVFHELLQYLYDRFYGQERIYGRELTRMKEYLDNHVAQNISLKELGEMVYLSESQVVRIFKRDLGRTPHEYILEMKLNQARKLLRNSRLMVREIAEYLGFCDEHYFSYVFRKKTGSTPLEYRKQGEL